jgi:hypothetical protein
MAAGLALGASLAAGQFANGVDLAAEDAATLLDLAGGTLNFALAGGAVGLVARLLERSAVQLRERSSRVTKTTGSLTAIRSAVRERASFFRRPRRPSAPASGPRGWPSASRSPGRSTTRCCRR